MQPKIPSDTVVEVGGVKIGGGHFAMIAGPCSVESREQIITVARAVQASGAKLLRGGAFKPRTSPYDFQGLKAEGIELLLEAKKATGMPIVSEIMNANDLPLFEEVDVIQVGARNMQNFDLLKELGRTGKAILLKRGLANTLKELLLSAENIMIGGNARIILCERGIRTFETHTRNTLDLSAVPALHELTHLPVVVDPSHATGQARLVEPMALAAAACGADGLMVGRGCFGDPWLFAQLRAALAGEENPARPPLAARIGVAEEQFALAMADKGEHIACLEARKYFSWYLRGVPYSNYYKERISKISSAEEVRRIAAGIRRDLHDAGE